MHFKDYKTEEEIVRDYPDCEITWDSTTHTWKGSFSRYPDICCMGERREEVVVALKELIKIIIIDSNVDSNVDFDIDQEIKMLELREKQGESIDKELDRAVLDGDLEKVKSLTEAGINVNADCDRALLVAIEEGHLEIAELLVEHGADISFMIDCDDLLRLAADRADSKMMKFLVRNGADACVVNILKQLHPSVRLETLECLVEHIDDVRLDYHNYRVRRIVAGKQEEIIGSFIPI